MDLINQGGENPPTQDIQLPNNNYIDNNFQEGNSFMGDYNTPVEKHTDLLKELTNFDPFLKTLVSEWLGMYWSQELEKYIVDKEVEPIMNIKGARWSINFLRIYTRNNNIITNLDKNYFDDIMEDIIETVLLNIGTRAEYFGVKNNGDILLVSNQLIHAAELILLGASGNRTYTDFLGTTMHHNETVNSSPQLQQNPSGGWLQKARERFLGRK